MMSVHDALKAWQTGEITTIRAAMRLTGAADVMDLYAFARASGVEIRTHLLPREEEQAERATSVVSCLIREEAIVTDYARRDVIAK